MDGTVRIYTAADGKFLHALEGPASEIEVRSNESCDYVADVLNKRIVVPSSVDRMAPQGSRGTSRVL